MNPPTARRTRSRCPIRLCSRRCTGWAAPSGFGLIAPFVTVPIPELADDIDTVADLERLAPLGGPRTRSVLALRVVKVALLSGGVGGARFARGLQAALEPGQLTVIGNVGDDVEVLGLHVSPDLDSVLYALADLHDEERGWGRAGETWSALESASGWGGEDWFRLGDLDIGLHLVRTQAIRAGEPLSAVTARLATAAGLSTRLVPATDDPLRTRWSRPPGRSGFRSGSWAVGTGTTWTTSSSVARTRPRRLPVRSRRSEQPMRS